jgi:hypothetical protein
LKTIFDKASLGTNHMAVKYFFDLAVYRLPEDQYYAERTAHVDRVVFPLGTPRIADMRKLEEVRPEIIDALRARAEESYGGIWRFNEVVGYIRLHFLGTQVRGEFYGPNRKRIVRTRTRTLEFHTWKLASEVEIETPITTIRISEAVAQYIADCRRELPTRFIDAELLESLRPHLDWQALFLAK